MVSASLPPPRRAGWRIFCFLLFLFRRCPAPPCSSESSGTHIFNKRAISYISGSQEGAVGGVRRVANTLPPPSPSLFASSQWCVVRGHHQAFSHSRCPSLGPGKCCAAHADSTSGRLSASRVESLCSTSLPHPGYVCGSVGPACTVSGSLASTPQPVSLAHPHHQTRLCDSVRPASPQVQGHPLHLCAKQRCPCLTGRDRSPPGEGHGRASLSSRYEGRVLQPLLHCAQERWWVAANLGPANLEPGSAQTPVQDVNAKTHFRVHPSPRLVCSDRPEGRVLSCLDSPPTQAIPMVCVRGSSVSVQGLTLRAVPVASRLYESRGGSHCSSQRMQRSHSQLSR